MKIPAPLYRARRTAWRAGAPRAGKRAIPEETAIALTYERVTHAVMMATPADLEDFAVGFSVSEGIIASPDEIETIEIVPGPNGIEPRMGLAEPRGDAFTDRRRHQRARQALWRAGEGGHFGGARYCAADKPRLG